MNQKNLIIICVTVIICVAMVTGATVILFTDNFNVNSSNNTTLNKTNNTLNNNLTKNSTKTSKSKYKVLTVDTKYDGETTKTWGAYKIETSTYEYSDHFKVCVLLYKNGELCNKHSYLSKVHYKYKGKWHWTDYEGYFSEWAYNQHWLFDCEEVGEIKIRFKPSN